MGKLSAMSDLQQVQLFGGPLDGSLQNIDLVNGRLPTSVYIAVSMGSARYARNISEPITGLVPVYRYEGSA